MLELLFIIGLIWIFGKLLIFGVKAAWGISKILVTVVFLPAVLVLMVLGGLIYIALPVLAIIGLISLVSTK